MIENLPVHINILFILTVLLTVWLFLKAVKNPTKILFIILLWLIAQSTLSLLGFYLNTETIPPRLIFLAPPALIFIVVLFLTKKGRLFIDELSPKWLTYLNVVRIPVEIVLFMLFLNNQIPQIMTFEGRNFDILAGLSAPFIAYLGYTKNKLNKSVLLLWNLICLTLLFNIVITGILSAPTPFQKFSFDQPNVAVLYFPFTLLVCFIVPVILFSHLALLRQLSKKDNS